MTSGCFGDAQCYLVSFSAWNAKYAKNRKDHYLPQGYLRQFTDPAALKTESKPLWMFDIQRRTWRRRSTAQIGWEPGFYDFVGRQGDRPHAEQAFGELENAYPPLIQKLQASHFREWHEHKDFFLRYVQMIRCRSPLFREQFLREWRDKRGARVIGIDGKKISVDSLRLRHFSPGALKEASIQKMMAEMDRGKAQLESFFWQLRLADSIEDCFVTTDQPLVASIDGENLADEFERRSTVLLFPICWQACLVGRRDPFSLSFTGSTHNERAAIRKAYLDSAVRFVVAARSLAGGQ